MILYPYELKNVVLQSFHYGSSEKWGVNFRPLFGSRISRLAYLSVQKRLKCEHFMFRGPKAIRNYQMLNFLTLKRMAQVCTLPSEDMDVWPDYLRMKIECRDVVGKKRRAVYRMANSLTKRFLHFNHLVIDFASGS